MQCTADFHDAITNAHLPQTAGVVDDATTLDTAVDMLDAHPTAGEAPIGRLLCGREFPDSRLSGRHDGLNLLQGEGQEAQILEQPTARRQGVGDGISNPFVMGTARVGLAQQENRERGVDQE
jgi:hypothetical protein